MTEKSYKPMAMSGKNLAMIYHQLGKSQSLEEAYKELEKEISSMEQAPAPPPSPSSSLDGEPLSEGELEDISEEEEEVETPPPLPPKQKGKKKKEAAKAPSKYPYLLSLCF
ncbi:22K [Lizard adenovirus 2]|uniref:22K n=1 Tax=Lizard adenovirus 2 TaxID=874272 RepID=A0A076FTG3_9ADEN|nr:22K [Lizard adenovirus 2]AII22575.1 22K [Lizard adenovirus 2]